MSKDAPSNLHIISDQRLRWGAHVCQYHTMNVTCQRFSDIVAVCLQYPALA
jgi:hypothetical protein